MPLSPPSTKRRTISARGWQSIPEAEEHDTLDLGESLLKLRISSVAALGVAVVTISDGNLFAASSSGIIPLMDVGYAPSLPAAGFSIPLSAADSILSPDPLLAQYPVRMLW